MEEGISLTLIALVVGGRQYPLSTDTYSVDSKAKPRKGVLGRVSGLVHKKHGEEGVVVPPDSRLTFTLAAQLDSHRTD